MKAIIAIGLIAIAIGAGLLLGQPSLSLGFVIAEGLIWAVCWIPYWQAKRIDDPDLSAKDRFAAESQARDMLLKAIGGAVVLAGLYFSAQELISTRDEQITDRFSKAVELIGNKNEDVRIGGIYALERISRDSVRDRWPVFEVLMSSARRIGGNTGQDSTRPMKPDVSAVITVLKRRDQRVADEGIIALASTVLNNVNLSRADLPGADFSYSWLKVADFSEAHLRNANFSHAHLEDANFEGASLAGADFSGADLTGADFTGAKLAGVRHEDADLTGAKGLPPEWTH